jgi:hypothetical protein
MTVTLERERAEGQEAKRIVESGIFNRAFNEIREDLIQGILNAPIRDTDGVHELKLMIHLADKLKARLEDTMLTGKMAELQLEREAKGQRKGLKNEH